MNIDDLLLMKHAQALLGDVDAVEAEIGRFNSRWATFWEKNADDLGAVLISHLAVEHYIDEWLAAANPGIQVGGGSRLTFAQKVQLLDGVDPALQWLLPGVSRLNHIRNKLVHDLEAEITDSDLDSIREVVASWHSVGGKTALVKDFALMVSGLLSSHASGIRKYGDGCGLIAYQRWLKGRDRKGDDET